MSEKKVFISYSHDSSKHEEKVLGLADRLRADGIDAMIDQYVNGSPDQGWPRWMLDQLDEADSVLVVCTETYYRRFRGHEVPGKGKGADWEGSLITQELYDSRSRTLKFVPIFLADPEDDWIPEPLRSATYYSVTSEDAYKRLYDSLMGQAGVEPQPLGEAKTTPRPKGTPLTFDKPTSAKSPAELVSPEDFVDPKVRGGAIELQRAHVDKSLTMKILIATLDRLFQRDTFRYEPSVGLCATQEWHYRLHGGIQTLRLMEEYDPFVEAEARDYLPRYRELTAEVSRYCQRMAAYLFEPAVGLSGLRTLVGTDAFVEQIRDKSKEFKEGVDSATCEKIDQHLTNAISQMKTLYDEIVLGVEKNFPAASPIRPQDSFPPVQSAVLQANNAGVPSLALSIWMKKLAFLQVEEARTADAEQKFSIQQKIEEARAKIQELGG